MKRINKVKWYAKQNKMRWEKKRKNQLAKFIYKQINELINK